MRFASIFLAMAILTAPAVGRDIFVNNMGGNDGYTGHQRLSTPDRSGPVQTIAKALRLAFPGDRIVLIKSGEPYRETITLTGSRHSGILDMPLTLEGEEGVVLEGSAPVPKGAWKHYKEATFRFRPKQFQYQNLFVDGRPMVFVWADPQHATPPKLEKREWCLHGGYIYFCVEPNMLPDDYDLSHTSLETGITLNHVNKVKIVGLTIQGFQVDGVNLANSARKIKMINCKIRGNGRNGITVGGASDLELHGCVVGNNGRAQILTLPHSVTVAVGTQLFSNTAPGRVDRGGKFFLNGKQFEGNIDDETLIEEVTGKAVERHGADQAPVEVPKDKPAGPVSPEGRPIY